MDLALTDWLSIARFEALLAMPFGEVWLAAAFLALTASAYASGVPGTLLPISFSSGALLGGLLGMAAVATGALIGSLVLYALLERGSQSALREKYGERLEKLEKFAARGGIFPIIGLRLAGIPHIAVTGLCALAAVGRNRYAAATMIGTFPAIALSATAGAAL
ncbi:SNARE associated Golgi protein [Tsuneonella dongtanensis]|uniref:SNARE associated Golgi protein n=1 Tax=Tsuneonella dongtanensis TaxID=692370 RepID=A0A1B2AFY2_9SPHN|nr:VTT domain-containing protein [Tsuneonella dongtanensis]ANY20945.1 SNARE associated Golgi protein [Tsuneonella dongtanensis]